MDADGWNLRYASEERVFAGGPNPVVVATLSALAPGRALELAAGEGRHALWLARGGWQVTAVDFSHVGLEKGRREAEREGLTVDWVLEDAYRYRPEPASFDLVLIAHFHPEPDLQDSFFSAIVGALVPGGHLLVLGRHRADIGRDGGRGPRDPRLRYTPEELRDALPATVELLRCEAVTRRVDTDAGPLELTDVVALGRRR
jgi:SAM-dependent methyltransferase